jgi:hypothetical protein
MARGVNGEGWKGWRGNRARGMNGEGYELYYEERLPTVVFGGGHMEMRMARMAKTLSMGTAQAVSDATILRNDSNLPAAQTDDQWSKWSNGGPVVKQAAVSDAAILRNDSNLPSADAAPQRGSTSWSPSLVKASLRLSFISNRQQRGTKACVSVAKGLV